jgi:hypothetical protein
VRGQNNAAKMITCTAAVNAPAMRRLFRRAAGTASPKRLGPPGSTGLWGRFSGGALNAPLIATPESFLEQNIILRQERGEVSSTILPDEKISQTFRHTLANHRCSWRGSSAGL